MRRKKNEWVNLKDLPIETLMAIDQAIKEGRRDIAGEVIASFLKKRGESNEKMVSK